ncbi:transposase [Niastella caeni]|uniref:Transposase n=1 Tax=Niastella caeni TaxID=2569763 RepID=A0A4S8HWE9_9BACT|nr:transposase [Niastella caeni]
MIEAANKQLKYRFLYHHYIADYDALAKYVEQSVNDYNIRPHHVLHGLTPNEVLCKDHRRCTAAMKLGKAS